jgi:hypothetical protein
MEVITLPPTSVRGIRYHADAIQIYVETRHFDEGKHGTVARHQTYPHYFAS